MMTKGRACAYLPPELLCVLLFDAFVLGIELETSVGSLPVPGDRPP